VASFGQVGITDSRTLSGTGDIKASQSYSGSGGYAGSFTLDAQGASGNLQGSATLTPQTLTASQDLSLTGDLVDTSTSLTNEGDSATLGVAITSGKIDSSQSIQTGSVDVRILANIEAQLVLYRQLVNLIQDQVNALTTTTINTPTSSPVVLNAAANSYTGSNLAYKMSGGNINVDDNRIVTGPAGSQVNIITQVTDAKSCDYEYYQKPIFSRDNRETLNVVDAGYIFARAQAGKNQYAAEGSEVSVNVNHGSLEGYSNKAYYDGTNFVVAQSANSASGISDSPYSPAVYFYQQASNAKGDAAMGGVWASGYSGEGFVKGFSGQASATVANVGLSQSSEKASGDLISANLDLFPVSTMTQVRNGAINGYSSSANINGNVHQAYQYVNSAYGTSASLDGSAFRDLYAGKSVGAGLSIYNSGSVTGYLNTINEDQISSTAAQSFDDLTGADLSVSQWATGQSAVGAGTWTNIYSGSLRGYSDTSTEQDGKIKTSQEFSAAEGNSIYIRPQTFMQGINGAEVNFNDQVLQGSIEGYTNDAQLDESKTSLTQRANSASGSQVSFSQEGSDQEGNDVKGSVRTQDGSISSLPETTEPGYSSTVNAMKDKVDLSQHIDSASGSQIFADSWASHIENGRHIIDSGVSTNAWDNAVINGYRASATANKEAEWVPDSYSATSSQYSNIVTGNNICFSGSATKYSADGFGVDRLASSHMQVDSGSSEVYDYSSTLKSTLAPWLVGAKSSQRINYAEGTTIEVGTQALDNVGGGSADVYTKVDTYDWNRKANIFLYYDTSESMTGKATSSANINAVGTSISVKAKADNINDCIPAIEDGFYKPGILQANKLSASIGIKAESNREPVITNKQESKGLALAAIQSNALQVGPINPGHIGVGIWNDDGTWTIGSLQGGPQWSNLEELFGASICPGGDNRGWSAHDLTWYEVELLLSSSEKDDRVNMVKGKVQTREPRPVDTRPGDAYDKIKVIKLNDDPDPEHANLVIDDFKNRGFWFSATHPASLLVPGLFNGEMAPPFIIKWPIVPGINDPVTAYFNDAKYIGDKYWLRLSNDCVDATDEALEAYGVNTPYAYPLRFPNDYFAAIQGGKEYSLNSDLKTYS